MRKGRRLAAALSTTKLENTIMLKHLAVSTALLALLGSAAQAQTTTIYNNTTTLKSAFENGGATAGNMVTDLVADDLNPVAGSAGKAVTQFTFSVFNGATVNVLAAVHVRFYDDFGTDANGFVTDGPGTYLGGVDYLPTTFTAGNVSLFTYTAAPGTAVFTIPKDNSLWAGVTFDANSATTSAANLNMLGQGLFNPPTVGGSDNMFFISDNPGLFASSNPAGSPDYSFGPGGPVANFGWKLQIATPAAAPEPSSFAALGVGVLGLGLLGLRAYKRRLEDAFGEPA